MELLEGETLAELLKREGRLTVEQALPVASQMAGALAAAHAAGIVHRDFKSNNVMILKAERPGGPARVVVTDFGIAYKLSDTTHGAGASLSVAGEVMGTISYATQQNVLARMAVGIAMGHLEAVRNPSGAIQQLESLKSEAVQRGILRYEFAARRAIIDIEGRNSAAGAMHLASLQKDAKARGYLLYAR